jgi:hypothetical protein
MADDDLKKKIAEALRDDREELPTEYDLVLHKLRDTADAIEATLKPSVIEVRIEPGHRVNMGQQYSFVIRVPSLGYRDVLLRAYVPLDGFPVSLDLFEDKHPHCASLEELEASLLEFLRDPDVKRRLLSLKDMAA